MSGPTQNLSLIGSAVLTFLDKNKRTDRQATFIENSKSLRFIPFGTDSNLA